MGYGKCEIDKDGEKDFLKNFGEKNKEPIIFDVGANVGEYTKECKRLIPLSEVCCFKPSKKTFQALKKNLKNFNGIRHHNLGFGEKKGKSTLYYDQEGSGLASLYNRKLDYRKIYFKKRETVNLETVDSFCEKSSIEKIDLLKIDVEVN